jgi:hypothetical protein
MDALLVDVDLDDLEMSDASLTRTAEQRAVAQLHLDAMVFDIEDTVAEPEGRSVEFRRLHPAVAWIQPQKMDVVYQNFYGGFIGAPAGDDFFSLPMPASEWVAMKVSRDGDAFPLTSRNTLQVYMDNLARFATYRVIPVDVHGVPRDLDPLSAVHRYLEDAPSKRQCR